MNNNKQKQQQKSKLQTGKELASKLDALLSRIPKGTFTTVGGALGGAKGAAIGAGISRITGYGDYTVTHNSLMGSTHIGEMADQVPVFRQMGADTRIKHCEFVADVVVPTNPGLFNNTTYSISPTDTATFPWLAGVANKYQKYKVRGMVIGYRSTSTDYNNNGVVAITINYDPAESKYTTMAGLLNNKFAVSTKPSNSMLAPVECDPARSPMDGYYIKHPSSTDESETARRQMVMGVINVATEGLSLPAGTTLGQLYISYDIEFLYAYSQYHAEPLSADSYFMCNGLVDWTDATTFNSTVDGLAAGNLLVPGGQVGNSVRWLHAPTTGGGYFEFILEPGDYIVSVSDGVYKSGGGDTVYGGTMTVANLGSSVSNYDTGYANWSGDTVTSLHYLRVGEGNSSQRSFIPNLLQNRIKSGNYNLLHLTFTVLKVG